MLIWNVRVVSAKDEEEEWRCEHRMPVPVWLLVAVGSVAAVAGLQPCRFFTCFFKKVHFIRRTTGAAKWF